MSRSGSRNETDMTTGSISRHLIMFALPLLVGNIFQQLYNTVDTWVVGNYVSNEAFGAVGTVGPIINLLIGFFSGLSSGAGAVISQYFGAKRPDKVHDAVHTAMVLTIILSVVFTALGILMIPFMLNFMKMPNENMKDATTYLTIYFAGATGLLFYNMGSGIMRAVGNSRKPFIYLVVSAVINTVLDLVFVLVFHMGVEGVAWATIIAQGVSAILVVIELMTTDTSIHLNVRDLRIDGEMLKKTFAVGIPAALQMAITSFSNVFVQSYINYFGSDFMSGWTAYGKIDQLILLPMQCLALACTTFVGQNLGKNDPERAKKGITSATLMSIASTLILMMPVMIFAPSLTAFFNDKPEVITYGSFLLRLISPFYVFCCINQVFAGALRGAGDSKVPMVIMLFSFVVFRQIYLFFVTRFIANTVTLIALAYPAGWIVASTLVLIYFRHAKLSQKRLV